MVPGQVHPRRGDGAPLRPQPGVKEREGAMGGPGLRILVIVAGVAVVASVAVAPVAAAPPLPVLSWSTVVASAATGS